VGHLAFGKWIFVFVLGATKANSAVSMKPSLLYRLLKIYCTLGLWFYFREWRVVNKKNIPVKGPVIYIANHQNAFIDAILMTCSSSLNPYYLARANVFKKSWAAKLLTLIRLMPIYRFRDGFNTLKQNDAIMQACVELLKNGETVLIFPEANHNQPYSTRNFQKGFARMAMMYAKQSGKTDLQILSVGIHYTKHFSFNGSVLLQYGIPFSVTDSIHEAKTERENIEQIVQVAEQALQKLVLSLQPQHEYIQRYQHLMDNRVNKVDMVEQLKADRTVAAAFPAPKKESTSALSVNNLLILPFTIYLYLTHWPLYAGIKHFVSTKIKDAQFINSVKFSIGIFATPTYYAIITLIFYTFSHSIQASLLFCISLPVSLLISLKANTK
jgi:1-acyl-sn-glycerol-3-phosphate acyltransferase